MSRTSSQSSTRVDACRISEDMFENASQRIKLLQDIEYGRTRKPVSRSSAGRRRVSRTRTTTPTKRARANGVSKALALKPKSTSQETKKMQLPNDGVSQALALMPKSSSPPKTSFSENARNGVLDALAALSQTTNVESNPGTPHTLLGDVAPFTHSNSYTHGAMHEFPKVNDDSNMQKYISTMSDRIKEVNLKREQVQNAVIHPLQIQVEKSTKVVTGVLEEVEIDMTFTPKKINNTMHDFALQCVFLFIVQVLAKHPSLPVCKQNVKGSLCLQFRLPAVQTSQPGPYTTNAAGQATGLLFEEQLEKYMGILFPKEFPISFVGSHSEHVVLDDQSLMRSIIGAPKNVASSAAGPKLFNFKLTESALEELEERRERTGATENISCCTKEQMQKNPLNNPNITDPNNLIAKEFEAKNAMMTHYAEMQKTCWENILTNHRQMVSKNNRASCDTNAIFTANATDRNSYGQLVLKGEALCTAMNQAINTWPYLHFEYKYDCFAKNKISRRSKHLRNSQFEPIGDDFNFDGDVDINKFVMYVDIGRTFLRKYENSVFIESILDVKTED